MSPKKTAIASGNQTTEEWSESQRLRSIRVCAEEVHRNALIAAVNNPRFVALLWKSHAIKMLAAPEDVEALERVLALVDPLK